MRNKEKRKTDYYQIENSAKIYLMEMNKRRTTSYRLSIYLHEKIDPSILKETLKHTLKRFPYYNISLKKNFFDYFFVENRNDINIIHEKKTKINGIKSFYKDKKYFRILYYNNCITLEIFHGLTDGKGAEVFLKVLTEEYLKGRGYSISPDENRIDINTLPSTEEYENSFNKVPKRKGKFHLRGKKAIQLDGNMIHHGMGYTVIYRVETEKLKEVSRKYNATITEFLLGVHFLALKKSTSKKKGNINIQVTMDLRKIFSSKTLKNFSMYFGIKLKLEEINNIQSIIKNIKEQLKEKKSRNNLEIMITHINKLNKKLKYIPLFIKKPLATIGYKLYGERIFTYTFTNLGTISFPKEMSKMVKDIQAIFYPELYNRAGCSIITWNKTTSLFINKRTKNPVFEQEMKKLLEKEGLHIITKEY